MTTRRSALPVAAFAVVALGAAAVQFRLMDGTMLWYDEVAWAFRYRHLGSGALELWGGWFDPLARITYNLLFATVGIASYVPFRLLAILANALLAAAVFAYGRRIGQEWMAVGAALVLLLLGSASSTVLQPLNSMNALAMASLPAGILLLERRSRRADLATLAVLLVALGYAGPIVTPVCAGLAVWVLVDRPVRWPTLAVPVVPVVVAGVARIVLPEPFALQVPYLSNIRHAPRFTVDLAGAHSSAVAGLTARSSLLVFAALVAGAAATVPRLAPPARRRCVALLAEVLAGWAVVAVARGHFRDPVAPRYILLTMVPALLVAMEVAAEGRVAVRRAVIGLAMACSLYGNAQILRDAAELYRVQAEVARAELGAMELVGERSGSYYRPDPRDERPLIFVSSGDWRRTTAAMGSPALRPAELPRASVEARGQVDRILVELGGMQVLPVPERPGPPVGCVPVGGGGRARRVVGEAGLLVRATGAEPVEVRVRRFADDFLDPPWRVFAPGSASRVAPLPDRSSAPWRIEVRGRAEVCA